MGKNRRLTVLLVSFACLLLLTPACGRRASYLPKADQTLAIDEGRAPGPTGVSSASTSTGSSGAQTGSQPVSTYIPPPIAVIRITTPMFGANDIGDGVNYHRAATCPADMHVIGGGCHCEAGEITLNYLHAGINGWYCGCSTAATVGFPVAFAVCASGAEPQLRTVSGAEAGGNANGDGVNYHRAATCPAGTQLAGGGCPCGNGISTAGSFPVKEQNLWYCACNGLPSGEVASAVCAESNPL